MFLTIIFLFSLFGCDGKNGMIVASLKCEYQTNPSGIDHLHPRFSWQLESVLRNKKQSAYRVLVSENPENLAKDNGKIWDSKKIESDQSFLIPFNGNILNTGQTILLEGKGLG